MGSTDEIPVREKEDMIEKKLVRIELEDGNRLLPKVYLEPNVFQELCTPWKDALVVKLLGKKLGYYTMKERLQRVWKLQGGFEIMDNDNGFYMVKLDQAADKEKIITGGPWLIHDHCLAVSHWSPEFASPNAKIERTVVWVRFPGLNLVYYDESFLMAMASAIGRPIKVDTNTLKVERGRFARVCVEVDLTVPVVGKIWVNGHWYKVQYEGLHLICTNCGCYGHLGRNCLLNPAATEPINMPVKQPNSGKQQPSNTDPKSNNFDPERNDPIPAPAVTKSAPIISSNEHLNELHGDWLLVTRRKKKPANNSTPPTQKNANNNNRFMALSPLSHANKNSNQNQNFPPRPKPHEITRSNKGNAEPKRRRPNDGIDDTIIQSTPPPTVSGSTKPVELKNQSTPSYVTTKDHIHVMHDNDHLTPNSNSCPHTVAMPTSNNHPHDQNHTHENIATNPLLKNYPPHNTTSFHHHTLRQEGIHEDIQDDIFENCETVPETTDDSMAT
ncbi:uncharacterized protein LOC123886756 [Trifolium pratense]|uniref:uncharacterized protein LOC123886756 n=1 Tax=Trifolium pratense TaxID=57577 RepID=UPI001E694BAA|nr:uncharacterized protein LOC123886756 [Trifolium pratense]